jgi:hypothetical protein
MPLEDSDVEGTSSSPQHVGGEDGLKPFAAAIASTTAPRPADHLLHPFLLAHGEMEEAAALANLIATHTRPLVRKVLARKVRGSQEDAEDLESRVVVLLLSRLRQMKSDGSGESVGDFGAYVAVTAYRVYHDHLREKYPERHRLKTRLRYLLTRDPTFALWKGIEGVWLCGFARWRAVGPAAASSDRGAALPFAPAVRGWEHRDLLEATRSVFESAGRPIELETLVRLLVDRSPRAASTIEAVRHASAEATRVHRLQADDRIFLKQLWAELCDLPLAMRTVLLLHLRGASGRDVIGLFPAMGIATLREIAATLEISVEELSRLWRELPLDDLTIAGRLNASRQQVINLRAAARRRLARRMGYEI